jgi:hypothetical protein
MRYRDEDGDMVTIANTPDLLEALSQAEKQGQTQLVVFLEGMELTNSFMTSGIRETAQKFSKPTSLLKEDCISSLDMGQSIILEDSAEHEIKETTSEVEDPADSKVPEEERSESYITVCFKCDGKGVGMKGQSCKFCQGSGSFDLMKKPKLKKLLEIVRLEVKACVTQHLLAREEEEVVHCGVKCDSCNTVPITGPRYKCTVCPNFDFCGHCEANVEHAHAFLKCKTPAQVPSTMVTTLDEREQKTSWRPRGPVFRRGGERFGGFCSRKKNRQAESDTRLGCRFVKDVVGRDGDYHQPRSNFLKTWRLRNAGAIPWPQGCKLLCVNGDFSGESVSLPELQPNEEVDVTVQCITPTEEGRFNSFWRAVDNEGTRFGQRIWITINVGVPIETDCISQLELLKELCYNDPEKVKAALIQAKGDLSLAVEGALS